MRHFQCTTIPPSPPCQGETIGQGDFGNFERVGVIGKCLLIFRVYYENGYLPQYWLSAGSYQLTLGSVQNFWHGTLIDFIRCKLMTNLAEHMFSNIGF